MSHAGINNSNPSATPTIPTSFVVDIGGPAVPSANVLDVLGGVGIQTSAVGNVLTITNTATASDLTFNTNSTPATSSLSAITFTGSGGLLFSGAGSTVIGALASIPNSSLTNSSLTITAGTGLSGGGAVSLGGSVSLNLSTPVTVPNGGTGTITLTDHGVLVGQGAGTITATAVGSTGQVLQGNTGANPTYSTATYPSTTTINQVLYSSAANTVTGLTTANNSILLTSATGVPSLGTSLLNDFTFTSATAAATRTLTVSNTDNTNAASNATIQALTGGDSAGDARYSASTTTTEWSFGVDNSVTAPTADPFVISQGAALGTNNIMSVATSGEINYPLQPSFQARATLQSNVTGDGTTYTLTFTSVIFDQNSDFDGTSTFTAPVTGKYFLYCNLSVGGVLSTHTTGTLSIVTTGRTYNYTFDPAKTFDVNTNVSAQLTALADMTAGNTAICQIKISNGTKVVDINTATNTYFCGFLQA